LLAQAVGREPHLREALLALSAETMRRRQEILGLDSREQFLHFGRVAGVTDERVEVEIAGFEEPLVVPLALLGDLPRVQPGDLVSLRRAARDSMAMRVAPAFDLGPDWTGTQQVAGRTARGRQRARASSNEEARSPSGTSGDGDSQAKRLLPYLGQWVALVGDQVVTAGPDVATVVGWLRRNGIKADTAFRVPTTEAAASGAAPQ
jgi:hypothetical protein